MNGPRHAPLLSLLLALAPHAARADGWSALPSPVVADYQMGAAGCEAMQFLDASTGFVVATNNDPGSLVKLIPVFLKTTDGSTFTGARIAVLGNPRPNAYAAVHFADATHGHVASNGKVARTTDGGASWTLAALPANASADFVWTVGPTTAVAAGANGIYRTVDGVTWTVAMPGSGGRLLPLGPMSGLCLGGPTGLMRSPDGGATWRPLGGVGVPGSLSTSPVSWSAAGDKVVWAIDSSGKLTRSSDAGDTWTAPARIADCNAMSVALLDEQHAIVGCKGGIDPMKTLFNLYTADGGTTWSHESWPVGWPRMGTGSGINGVACVAFPSAGAAYAGWDFYEKQLLKRGGGGSMGGADMASAPPVDMADPMAAADLGIGGSGDGGSGGSGGGGGSSGGCSLGAGRGGDPAARGASLALLAGLLFAGRRRADRYRRRR